MPKHQQKCMIHTDRPLIDHGQARNRMHTMLMSCERPKLLPAAAAQRSFTIDESLYANVSAADALGVRLPPTLEMADARRKVDFMTGRYCALLACRDVCFRTPDEIAVSARGIPEWPAGLVGSITHTTGFVSAAVAHASVVRGLGIDSEQLMTSGTAEEVRTLALSQSEQRLGYALAEEFDQRTFCTIIFSAKESIYKCLNPLVGKFFDFLDCKIVAIDLATRVFRFCLLISLDSEFICGWTHEGWFELSETHAHTAVQLSWDR